MPETAASLRNRMVETQLRPNDVTDARVLAAMGEVPRERFVPSDRRAIAYLDRPIELAPGRMLMDPRSFAKLLQLAQIGPDDVVLDIGCGSGYSAAVIGRLAGTVVALEQDPDLFAQASQLLTDLSVDNVAVVSGTLARGYPKGGPYDLIVLEGAAAELPLDLHAQLNEGGRLVGVIQSGPIGRGQIAVKSGEGWSVRVAFDASLARLPGFEREMGFVF
ncbi:MAG: methyltransferase domain-containing protein [Alphaproteobacteria bacterium]|nr:methyltransferase domain-containing protein [Alphaproteobacteria bacterium]